MTENKNKTYVIVGGSRDGERIQLPEIDAGLVILNDKDTRKEKEVYRVQALHITPTISMDYKVFLVLNTIGPLDSMSILVNGYRKK